MSFLLQNLAAESDIRTTAVDYRWWSAISADQTKARVKGEFDDVAWVDVRFAVCPLCDGKGKHVNPSIDAHGLTAQDFDEDPDFAEGYFAGDYDITCNLCHGEKVIPVPTDPEVLEAVEQQARWDAEARAEMLAEMRVGA